MALNLQFLNNMIKNVHNVLQVSTTNNEHCVHYVTRQQTICLFVCTPILDSCIDFTKTFFSFSVFYWQVNQKISDHLKKNHQKWTQILLYEYKHLYKIIKFQYNLRTILLTKKTFTEKQKENIFLKQYILWYAQNLKIFH